MKWAYVRAAQAIRAVLLRSGLLGSLDRWAARSRLGKWFRSLLSVYDLADLVPLDVPWWTFAASSRVEAFLASRSDARVLEWGSGASTVWLAKRSVQVTAIEHDIEWADELGPFLPANARLVVRSPGSAQGRTTDVLSNKPGFAGLDFSGYVQAVDDLDGDFDLIVVDGRAREACLLRAIDRLAPGGVIVFDNVERSRYRDAINTASSPLTVEWTRGLTPCLPYPAQTALITRPAVRAE